MFLNREGNKKRYSQLIIDLFPKHRIYIEPFFGVGGIFFNKPLAKYNIVNDSSSFIYDMWIVFKDKDKIDLIVQEIEKLLIYKKVLILENSLASKLLFSCASLYSQGNTLRLESRCLKTLLLKKIQLFKNIYYKKLNETLIDNKDCFHFLESMHWGKCSNPFVYCDPPYSISKGILSDNKGWSISKLEKLIIQLNSLNVNYAISEYNDIQVLELFELYNLKTHLVSRSHCTIKKENSKYEILAINYDTNIKKQQEFRI